MRRLSSSLDLPMVFVLKRSACAGVQADKSLSRSPVLSDQTNDLSAASGVAKPAKASAGDLDDAFATLVCASTLSTTTVVVPAATMAIAPTTAAVLSLVHAISFNVVFMRVKVEAVTTVPLTAATVTEVASPIGAA